MRITKLVDIIEPSVMMTMRQFQLKAGRDTILKMQYYQLKNFVRRCLQVSNTHQSLFLKKKINLTGDINLPVVYKVLLVEDIVVGTVKQI